MEKPRMAKAELLGMQGPEAEQLRADADQMSGALEQARRYFAATDQELKADESAILAGDLSAVIDLPEVVRNTGPSTGGMLSRTAQMLDQSASVRQSISALLQDPDLQIGTSN